MALLDQAQFRREAEATVVTSPYGDGHRPAVELMVRALRDAGFGEGLDVLDRHGLLECPERDEECW